VIRLTRLSGESFYLNEDLIERVEEHHDTTIVTIHGNVYTVVEKAEQVVDAVTHSQATVRSLAMRMAADKPCFSVITGGE